MNSTFKVSVLFLMLLFNSTSIGEELQKKTLIALNSLLAQGITEHEAVTLTDVLRNELINTGKFQVMERGQMEEILKEQAFQMSGTCDEAACLVEMGQLLGIEQLFAGTIGKVGRAYSINVRIISVQTGKILKSVSHSYSGPIENLLTGEMRTVAKMLIGDETGSAKKLNKKRRTLFIAGGIGVAGLAGGAVFLILGPGQTTQDTPSSSSSNAEVNLTW